MIPPQKEFERIPTNDFINAEIVDIIYDEHHEFNVYQSDEKEIAFGVQFVLGMAGLERPKKTKWFRFSYDDRANLYKLFVAPLVKGAQPYMEFDLDQLKGMQVKILWKDDKDPRYQSIDSIRPAGSQITPNLAQPPQPVFKKPKSDDDVPF